MPSVYELDRGWQLVVADPDDDGVTYAALLNPDEVEVVRSYLEQRYRTKGGSAQ